MRRMLILLTLATGIATLAASPIASGMNPSGAVISTMKVGSLGTILVNSKGLTLYMFVPDKHSRVTCTGSCAAVWPPVKVGSGVMAVAKSAAKSKLLGSDPNPAGGRVVTYNGWPLYTYVADRAPGMATGEGLKLNGGLWYVLSPSGSIVKGSPVT